MSIENVLAQAVNMYVAASTNAAEPAEEAARNVVLTVSGPSGGSPIPAEAIPITLIVFGSFVLAIVAIILFLVYRSRRNERLIALAIQNNQPELAREMVGSRFGVWRALAVIIVLIAALSMWDSHPWLLFTLALVTIVFLFAGRERRKGFYKAAADTTAEVRDWLSKKAESAENGQKPSAPGSDKGQTGT